MFTGKFRFLRAFAAVRFFQQHVAKQQRSSEFHVQEVPQTHAGLRAT